MAELLLELFSEEIPARMQARAREDFARLLGDKLGEAGLEYKDIKTFATPRRLTAVVDGLPARSPDMREERKGPRVDAPEAAIKGFLKSAGLASVDQAEKRDDKKGAYYVALIEKPAAPPPRWSPRSCRRSSQLPLAEIDALGVGKAALGASAPFHPLPVRRQGRRVRDRRHKERQGDARPPIHGAGALCV